MSHLSPEHLARLVDETPTATEAAHLAACAECAGELDAMRAEHDALGTLPRILPVPTSWEVMRHRLEREGLVHGAPRRTWVPGVAAAFALFLAGGATGVAFAGGLGDAPREVAVVGEPVAPSSETPAPVVAIESNDSTAAAIAPEPEPAPAAQPKLAARDEFDPSDTDDLPGLYGTPAPGSSPNWDVLAARASSARTPDEAARFVRDAEGAYLAAMTRLAELTEAQSSDPAVRLATLDGIVVTTAAALERAPADPVINGYHLAARAQRDALLRTVSSSPAQDPWY